MSRQTRVFGELGQNCALRHAPSLCCFFANAQKQPMSLRGGHREVGKNQCHCEEGEARRGNPPQASRALARDLKIASSA